MTRRSGQAGTVVRKGKMWHGRYYADLPGQYERKRMSVLIGPIAAMTKSEARRKLQALLSEMGINSESHFDSSDSTDADLCTGGRMVESQSPFDL